MKENPKTKTRKKKKPGRCRESERRKNKSDGQKLGLPNTTEAIKIKEKFFVFGYICIYV